MGDKNSFEWLGFKGEGLLAILFVAGLVLYFLDILAPLGKAVIILSIILMIIEITPAVLPKLKDAKAAIFKRTKNNIPIKDKFHTGFEPNSHSRQTKWNYKNFTQYYFVPLLSHGYNTVTFVELTGPWCKKCDHLLCVTNTLFGQKFKCNNCLKKFTIPNELVEDYQKRLFGYFKAEYDCGRLREVTGL